VLDMHTIKPLDGDALVNMAQAANLVVTLEDHNIIGGLGGAVAEYLSEHLPRKILRIGVRDVFTESGEPQQLFRKYHMDMESIVEMISAFPDDK
jgi:transketolase